ncbi:MAG: SDR family NAD(P)-dependent oxidoreductase [Candidatus Margulisbacteria bacterium]|nr:SDR family NAD(P)-dependent oxidoreductase [Candidatus Margulisiibacteriota bacterium]
MAHKKILITGGAGFIGSHLAQEASYDGLNVVVLDNLSSGKPENLNGLNNIEIIEQDIRNADFINKLFAREKFDLVFHEAAIASVQKSISDPKNTYNVNVTGTNNIFKAALDNGVEKVVFASSAAVYGNDPLLPKKEIYTPRPVSPYGQHKLENENTAKKLSAKKKTDFVALRYFNVFGERQDPDSEYSGVISIFMNKISKDLPINIYGDGQQTRDFIYVKDIVKANFLAAEINTDSFSSFNVGTGIQTSILEMAKIIYKSYQKKEQINFLPGRKGDIKHSLADITAIKTYLDFFPEWQVASGIDQIVKHNG